MNEPGVLDRLPGLLPPGWKPAASPVVDRLYSLRVGGAGAGRTTRRFNLLYAGAARLARTLDLDEAFETLAVDARLHVAEAARRRLFVHAGVVGWQGRAIVVPGRSFSGKTTLVAALLRAGATYHSDEYAVFDASGRVHPYPTPLSVRHDTGVTGYPAEALGGLPGVGPLPVGLIVVARYQPGATWRPRRLSPGQAVMALLANTVAARRRPRLALATLPRAVSEAAALKGARGEAAEIVESLLEAVSTERR